MAEDDDVRRSKKVLYYSRGYWSSSPPSDLTYDVASICMYRGDFSRWGPVAVPDFSIEVDRIIEEADKRMFGNFAKQLQKEKEAALNEARRKEGATPGSAGGLKGPDLVFVGGLPYYFTEPQIRELLETFGPLRGFDLVKDRETGNSKGYAFCVYQDLSVTDIACAALNGIKMGDKLTLTVRCANQGTIQPKPEQESALLHAQQQIALQEQAQMSEEREELDKMLEEYRRRVEEAQRREALERKEEERYRELELIKRQKEESAWRMKLEEVEERAKQLKVSGKSQPRSNLSFGMGL